MILERTNPILTVQANFNKKIIFIRVRHGAKEKIYISVINVTKRKQETQPIVFAIYKILFYIKLQRYIIELNKRQTIFILILVCTINLLVCIQDATLKTRVSKDGSFIIMH